MNIKNGTLLSISQNDISFDSILFIPKGVTKISRDAICSVYSPFVKEISLPDTIEEIEEFAFATLHELRFINIPEKMTKLNSRLFLNTPKLEGITIPSGIKIIDDYCFLGSGIQNLTLKHNLKEINSYAFASCINLQEVEIPDSVEKIGFNAFENCKNLKKVTISSNVKSLELHMFKDCNALEVIHWKGNTYTMEDLITYEKL